MESVVRAFLDSIRAVGCSHAAHPPGDYFYFVVSNDGDLVLPGNHGYYFMEPFVHRYTGESNALKQLVKRYAETYDDSLSIAVFNSKGETLYSWTLRQN